MTNVVQINQHTSLIDFELYGIREVGALYLLRAGKSRLIDSGTRAEAKSVIKVLDAMGAFPPDMIVLTHSHFDHAQGAPALCREAEKRGSQIVLLASEKSIPYLKDQSWNEVFDDKHTFENLAVDVTPLADGQVLDLDGLELEVFDLAGHCADDIGLYDALHRTLFAGDALGNRIKDTITIPLFMPPFWDADGFRSALERIQRIDTKRLCLAHFGCLKGDAARDFVKDAIPTYEAWWGVFSRSGRARKLDDVEYIQKALIEEVGIVLPDLEVSRLSMHLMLRLANGFKRALGQKPIQVADIQLQAIAGWLAKRYRTYTARA